MTSWIGSNRRVSAESRKGLKLPGHAEEAVDAGLGIAADIGAAAVPAASAGGRPEVVALVGQVVDPSAQGPVLAEADKPGEIEEESIPSRTPAPVVWSMSPSALAAR